MNRSFIAALLVAVSALTFISCSKSKDDDKKYFVRGQIDGEAFSFSSTAQMSTVEVRDDLRSVTIGAIDQVSRVRAINISLNLFDDEQLEVREYTEGSSNPDYHLAAIYYGGTNNILYTAGMYTPSVKSLTLRILSLTDKEISGTFEGAFYTQRADGGNYTGEYLTVTRGEFKVPVKK